MKNKLIYMIRTDLKGDIHFIFKIDNVENSSLPIKYSCSRIYALLIPKEKNDKACIFDNLTDLELTNNDILYQLSSSEYLSIFKTFINLYGTTIKVKRDSFII